LEAVPSYGSGAMAHANMVMMGTYRWSVLSAFKRCLANLNPELKRDGGEWSRECEASPVPPRFRGLLGKWVQ
jgi:hypothetical protein